MSVKRPTLAALLGAAALIGSLAAAGQAQAAATIIINNINAPGIGFNDPTPATPVGGNAGVTVGEQRLIAFTYAANIWGATLTSTQPIVINAQFTALTCSAASGVLGSAGATQVFSNFANAPQANTWYSYALANRISGLYQGTANAAQINSNFNANLGSPTGGNTSGVLTNPPTGCLTGSGWYYGLDGNHGALIDFIAVLQHEMAHGLGFQTFTSGLSGNFLGTAPNQFPSIWDHFLFGVNAGKLWKDMTPAERVASATSLDKLVWTGANVNSSIPDVLRFGLAGAVISGPAAGAAAGTIRVGEASFGQAIGATPVSGQVMPIAEQTAGGGAGCAPLNAANALAVNGRVALMARGVCGFAVKVKNAQDAGAIAVLISDNVVENAAAPSGLGGADATITIPAVRIFLADGDRLREAAKRRSRTGSGVSVAIGLVVQQYAGADALNRAQMFAPNPFQSGSSVSHFDSAMFRNQLMEPAINGDLTQSVLPPQDLTFRLFQDIGWEVGPVLTRSQR
ncbi:MAG: peptidase [Rubrivivax sp.]|nr:peptidase [Rubrivivax sp.]